MAALEAAIALAQVDDRSAPVAHDLHLDVPRPGKELLDVEVAIPERRPRLGAAARPCVVELVGPPSRTHAAPAAPGDGLHHDGSTLAEREEEGPGLLDARFRAGAT